MISTISLSDKEKDLDRDLKLRYGKGMEEFNFSLRLIYEYFYTKKAFKTIQKRSRMLEGIINKLMESLDNYLISIYFYNSFIPKNKRWTTLKRYAFIIRSYRLEEFYILIKKQIKLYKKYENQYGPIKNALFPDGITGLSAIRAIGFIVLVWAHVLKRKKRVDWVNMNLLLRWYAENRPNLMNLFGITTNNIPNSESLRANWNKNRIPEIIFLATIISKLSFFKVDKSPFKLDHLENTDIFALDEPKKEPIFYIDLDIIKNSLII